VPSRLYARPSKVEPLSGVRLGLKDIFKLAGIKRTMMGRAYTALYETDSESAHYVTKPPSLGAVVVGKTKMTSFASSEEPTDQWIDFHCPINPRGDTYQSPSGSSSGAAASLAGYPWLDVSVAGDCKCNSLPLASSMITESKLWVVFAQRPRVIDYPRSDPLLIQPQRTVLR
jgi:hypothetical protein